MLVTAAGCATPLDSVQSTANDAVTLAASGRKSDALPALSLALEAIADMDGSEESSLLSGSILHAALLYRLYEINVPELASNADQETREQSQYLLTVLDAAGNRENLLAKAVETLRGLDADLTALAQPPYNAPLWARTDCLLAMAEHTRLLAARPDDFFQKYTSPQFPAAFAVGRIRTILAGISVNFAAAAVRSAVEAATTESPAGKESLSIARSTYQATIEAVRRMRPRYGETPPPPARPETIMQVTALAVRQPAGSDSADPESQDCLEPCVTFLSLESGPHQVRGRSALDWAISEMLVDRNTRAAEYFESGLEHFAFARFAGRSVTEQDARSIDEFIRTIIANLYLLEESGK